MRVTVIGTGYVGLTTGVTLAFLGHHVVAVDKDRLKLDLLRCSKSPIHEPGLDELLAMVESRIRFSDQTVHEVADADVLLIAVGTPSKDNGEADTRYVEAAAQEIAFGMEAGRRYTVVVKSTVPIGTNRRVSHVINQVLNKRGISTTVHVASNPEFLREGFALRDTLYTDRIVVGTDVAAAAEVLRTMYRPILEQTFLPPAFLPRPEGYVLPPLIMTDPTSSELIKYAANAFLAVKISFINEMAGLCERVGADVTEVAGGIGLDSRIGSRFLSAGLGWGGSCFPKDTAALIAVARDYGYSLPIVSSAREVNVRQRISVVDKLQKELKVLRGRIVGVFGLAFKPDTDDVRESPAIDLVRLLTEQGVLVRVHDPIAMNNGRQALSGLDVEFCDNPYQVARGADAIVLATEWPEYRGLDLRQLAKGMRSPVLVDGRNQYSPDQARAAGFIYHGVGR